MNKLFLPNYNLHWTLMGGQSFGWDFDGEYYYGFTQDRAVKLKQVGDELYWQTYPQKDDFEFMEKYLRLDTDYETILKKIDKDLHMKSAINQFPNLRLLHQGFEETTLSFIMSAFNNIKKIRMSIRLLNTRFGQKVMVGNKEIFLFPKTEVISNATEEDLRACKLGYRAPFVKRAAEHLLSNGLNKSIVNLDEFATRKELIKLPGVGEKVADCILTFGLAFDNVTPMDVWAKRVYVDLYNLDPKIKHHEARAWVNEYFEGHGAWAGQFLFEYIRSKKK
jgi:N-glycosylase/DNA lyase